MTRTCLLLAGASLAAVTVVAPAQAQTLPDGQPAEREQGGDAPSGTTPPDSNDIVVTAQRRAESLQSVPISVSAFTGEALERQQINNATDLQLSLPNITFTKTNFTSSSFTIRGIGDLCVGFSCDQATGIHVNDMPLTSTRLFETEYFDLERVEVLRGPQGTLFGRNATSGVVNFITARPELGKFAGSGTAEIGNFDSRRLSGMINVPIGDSVGLRVAGYYLKRDGFTRNLFDNSRIDGRDLYALRGTLRIRPTASTTIDLIAYHFREDDDRSRIQKQLCNNDPTGILGCLPDQLAFETVNGKSTLAATLSSRQFINIAAQFNPAITALNLGLVDLNAPADPFYGGVVNPSDLRTVNIDFKPRYRATETHYMGRVEQGLGEQFSITLTGGYARNTVDSRTDYNLVAGNSLSSNPGFLQLAALGYLAPGAAFPGGVNPFTQIAQALIPNAPATLASGNVGAICLSEANLLYSGVFGGQVNRCGAGDYDRSRSTARQYSLEAHLDSDFEGPFNFLVGAIWLDNRFRESDYFVVSTGLDYASGVLGAINAIGRRAAGLSTPNLFTATPFFNSEIADFRLRSRGVFGEGYFEVKDRLKLTVGLRWNNDRKRQSGRSPLLVTNWLVPVGTADADTTTVGVPLAYDNRSARFSRLTGRLVADYRLTRDNLLYASYSRGYKSGGINPPIDPQFNVSPTFEPEQIDAFEIGSKNSFAGGMLRLNASAFYYKYKGLQLSRIVARTSVNDNTDADIYGAEVEAVVRPTSDLLLNLSASYLKSEIKGLSLIDPRDPSGGRSDAVIIKDLFGGRNCVVASNAGNAVASNTLVTAVNGSLGLNGPVPIPATATTGAFGLCDAYAGAIAAPSAPLRALFATPTGALPFQVLDGVAQDLSGNELPQAPNWKLAAGGQYTLRLGGGATLVPRIDWNWTGSFYARSFNRPVDKVRSYSIINAQLQLNGAEDRWFARAFVQNLANNDAITGQFVADASSGLFTNIFTLEPRRYGLALGFNF